MEQQNTDEPAGEDQIETPSYEESFTRVEELVKELESGELSLKQSLRKYEEAVKSMNRCYELLDEAQKKIEMLVKDAEGRISGREDFEAE
jgi:exodeoxyribonuclease VII small subunit